MANKIIYVLLCGVMLTACNSKKEAPDKEEKKSSSNTIILTAEQFKAAGIELGSAEQKNLHGVVKATGYLAVPPQNKANVSSFIGGIVKSISVVEGIFVKQGQTLALLESTDFIKMQQDYLTEKNNFSFLEEEYKRQKELAEQNAGTGKVLQKAESEYNISKAKLSSLEAQLKMLSVNVTELSKGVIIPYITLSAPIDGYVGHINATIGSYSEPNKTLFEITDNTKIHCDLFIYEKDIFKVKVGQKVHFILTNLPEHQEEHQNKTIEGEIFGINKSFENETKALTVHAKIVNENHELIPGMYVNALIDIGEQTVLAVPTNAVVQADGKEWVFITNDTAVKAENEAAEKKNKSSTEEDEGSYTFRMVEVITGISELGYIEIKPLENISPTAMIVIKNPFFILSKAKEGDQEGE